MVAASIAVAADNKGPLGGSWVHVAQSVNTPLVCHRRMLKGPGGLAVIECTICLFFLLRLPVAPRPPPPSMPAASIMPFAGSSTPVCRCKSASYQTQRSGEGSLLLDANEGNQKVKEGVQESPEPLGVEDSRSVTVFCTSVSAVRSRAHASNETPLKPRAHAVEKSIQPSPASDRESAASNRRPSCPSLVWSVRRHRRRLISCMLFTFSSLLKLLSFITAGSFSCLSSLLSLFSDVHLLLVAPDCARRHRSRITLCPVALSFSPLPIGRRNVAGQRHFQIASTVVFLLV